MYTIGKPDNAGGPLERCTDTGKPVHRAEAPIVYNWEARQSGRPSDQDVETYMKPSSLVVWGFNAEIVVNVGREITDTNAFFDLAASQ